MSRFAIRKPYFFVACLIVAVVGRAVPGGMSVSLTLTAIMVPAAYYAAYRRDDAADREVVR